MDKTININIAGILFQIDEEAFRILRDYLQAINNRFRNVQGGHETIEDIESRIAEIFQSQKGTAGIINGDNVEAMISIIGKPEDFDNNEAEPENHSYTSQKKRMYRNPDDTIISGVCGGIGAYLNTDPVLFRILFVIFTIFFGLDFLSIWLSGLPFPLANTDSRKREMYGKSYPSVMSYKRHAEGAILPDVPHIIKDTTTPPGSAMPLMKFSGLLEECFILHCAFADTFRSAFVLIGLLLILSFVMLLVFKYPASFPAAVLI